MLDYRFRSGSFDTFFSISGLLLTTPMMVLLGSLEHCRRNSYWWHQLIVRTAQMAMGEWMDDSTHPNAR
jgi:hypothetical protein